MMGSKNVFSTHRNEKCIDCGICEKTCPTGGTELTDFKQEYYMCIRCEEDFCPKIGISNGKRPDR